MRLLINPSRMRADIKACLQVCGGLMLLGLLNGLSGVLSALLLGVFVALVWGLGILADLMAALWRVACWPERQSGSRLAPPCGRAIVRTPPTSTVPFAAGFRSTRAPARRGRWW